MIDTVYVEHDVAAHPRTRAILARLPRALVVPVDRYGEVFNRKAQSFRLQKARPALVLARRRSALVLPAPPGWGLGRAASYYFSPMLNCVYDCRYCFLQGMLRSAHYVVFVNDEELKEAIDETLAAAGGEADFFGGYDGDSLALDGLTGFTASLLPFFAERPGARLELRTKSTRIGPLLGRRPLDNVIVAFSFTPEPIRRWLEHRVASVARRLDAARRLARRGWRIGLRFDPLVYVDDYRPLYRELFAAALDAVPAEAIDSVSLGAFRLPRDYFRTMTRMYPDEPLFAGPLVERDGFVSYPAELEEELRAFARAELADRLGPEVFFDCPVEATR